MKKVSLKIEKDSSGIDCVTFYNSDNKELFCLRLHQLKRIDPNYIILDKYEFGVVLNMVVKIATFNWVTMEALIELTKIIQNKYPEIVADIIADTFRAIKLIEIINKHEKDFKALNEIGLKNKDEFQKEFKKYLDVNLKIPIKGS
jgi:hypothetical protein